MPFSENLILSNINFSMTAKEDEDIAAPFDQFFNGVTVGDPSVHLCIYFV